MSKSPVTNGMSRTDFLTLTAASLSTAALSTAALPAFAQTYSMATKPIPKSTNGEMLPVIGVGTNRFGRDGVTDDIVNVIRNLLDGGASVIDTAEGYGRGESETVIGQVLAQIDGRDRAFLVTKSGQRGREASIAAMEDSFKQLRTDVIDVMLVHNLADTETQLPIMKEWKQAGRFRYIGASHSQPEAQEALADLMAKDDIDFVQMNYSVDVRGPEQRLLPMAADRGVAVMANIPLGRGRLLDQVKGQEVPEWAQKELNCKTFAQLLLKFVISHPSVNVAIPGTTTPKYMADNVGAGQGPLADERQRARIAAIWNA